MKPSTTEALILRRWRQTPKGFSLLIIKGEGTKLAGIHVKPPKPIVEHREPGVFTVGSRLESPRG